jgi:hypothetical protein
MDFINPKRIKNNNFELPVNILLNNVREGIKPSPTLFY